MLCVNVCARVLFLSSVHELLIGWFIAVDLPTQCRRQHVGLLQSASCMTVTGCCGCCLNQRAPITGLASQQQLALRNWNASAIFADMFVVIPFGSIGNLKEYAALVLGAARDYVRYMSCAVVTSSSAGVVGNSRAQL